MNRFAFHAFFAVTLVLSSGALSSGAGAQKTIPAPGGVKVQNTGAAPLTALRYAFKKGQQMKGKVQSDMTMAMTIGMQAMPKAEMPTVTQDLTLVVSEVDAAGNFHLDGEIKKVIVAKKGDPKMVTALETQLKPLAGSKFFVTMTPRGAVVDARYDLPAGTQEQLRETLEGVVNGLKQVLPLLPEEPVGAGAEWSSQQKLKVSFADADQDAKFKLLNKRGDICEIIVTVAQRAGRQKVSLPGMQPGQTAELTKLNGNAQGVTKVSLSKPGVRGDVRSDISMEISAQGQSMNMDMGVAMRFFF
jgi:hypothetical protein